MIDMLPFPLIGALRRTKKCKSSSKERIVDTRLVTATEGTGKKQLQASTPRSSKVKRRSRTKMPLRRPLGRIRYDPNSPASSPLKQCVEWSLLNVHIVASFIYNIEGNHMYEYIFS